MPTIVHVVGARPNFMKIAPVIDGLRPYTDVKQLLIHTGQHYDERMAKIFFEELGLPRPDRDLEVGSGSQAEQTGAVMTRFERVVEEERPDLVVVVGDVNSTLAATLVAAKAGVPVAHVESGLRSFDMSMPEEINRLVTDRLSTILLTPSADANVNLRREGVPDDRIFEVGNVMIDTLMRHRPRAPWSEIARRFALTDRGYAVLTLHRPANVDAPEQLGALLGRLAHVTRTLPIVFPIHPRTAKRLDEHGLRDRLGGIALVEPLGYLEFLGLLDHAACVLTDSGGIQEETTVLGVPCFTLRDNTERPVTIEQGTNTLVGADGRDLAHAFEHFRATGGKRGRVPAGWDGQAGARTGVILAAFLNVAPVAATPGVV